MSARASNSGCRLTIDYCRQLALSPITTPLKSSHLELILPLYIELITPRLVYLLSLMVISSLSNLPNIWKTTQLSTYLAYCAQWSRIVNQDGGLSPLKALTRRFWRTLSYSDLSPRHHDVPSNKNSITWHDYSHSRHDLSRSPGLTQVTPRFNLGLLYMLNDSPIIKRLFHNELS